VVEAHFLALEFGNPLMPNTFGDCLVQEVLDTFVSLKFCLLCFVFGNLSLTNNCIRINIGRVSSRVDWSHKKFAVVRELDVISFSDDHSNVSMLASSICGRNAGRGVNTFFDELIQILVRWLAVNDGELKVF
jgi:hypothetical protein